MPVTILSSDIAYAVVGEGRLALYYTGECVPPGYYLVLREVDGTERSRRGPFPTEDLALEAAHAEHGELRWKDL